MFGGIHAVLYAFFQADERIDPGAMQAQVAYCLEKGCNGITVLGLATEVLKLTPTERHQMVEIVAKALAGSRPFSVTIAGNSVNEQSEMLRVAEANGANWLILQPPMVGNYEAAVYHDFFTRVAENTDLPVAIQNASQYLGRGLSVADIELLRSRCTNLAAIKSEDSVAELRDLVEIAGRELAVLGGRGGQELIECLQVGAKGFVLAPEIAPVASRIFAHWTSGRTEEATTLFASASPAIEFTMQSLEHLIAYGKRSFAEQASLIVHDRSPALKLDMLNLAAASKYAQLLRDIAL